MNVKYNRMNEMYNRCTRGMGVKDALTMLVKDELRVGWQAEWAVLEDLAKTNPTRLKILAKSHITDAIIDLMNTARSDERVKVAINTPFGDFTGLSGFGTWLVNFHEYCTSLTDVQAKAIATEALRLNGLL